MMKYILSGEPNELAKVIQENRIRVERGLIKFEPVQPETALEQSLRVTVPKTPETVPNLEETAEKAGKSVPKTPETDTDAMDDKQIDVEDLKEVDLDADDKAVDTDDAKDVPADDSKEAEPAKKTPKRSQKSE